MWRLFRGGDVFKVMRGHAMWRAKYIKERGFLHRGKNEAIVSS